MGLWSAASVVTGCVSSSGILTSPQGVLVYMGSPRASPVVWAVCGLLALLGALCYTELGALVPESGGGVYVHPANLRLLASLPGHLHIAATSLSPAEYAVSPLYPTLAAPHCPRLCSRVWLPLASCCWCRLTAGARGRPPP